MKNAQGDTTRGEGMATIALYAYKINQMTGLIAYLFLELMH